MKLYALAVLVLTCASVCGCHTVPTPRAGKTTTTAQAADRSVAVRNNCYSLLYDLLGDEKHVSKLLIIKRESTAVNRLIKDIARAAGDAAERLESLKKADAGLALDALNLPPGEAATREAIASTKTRELLGNSGDAFEQALLFTQAQAMNYAAHLAVVAANSDADTARAAWLKSLSEIMRRYYVRCVELMDCPPRDTAQLQSWR